MKGLDKFIILIVLVGGIWLVLSSGKPNLHQITPEKMLSCINKQERCVSTDEVAKFIMGKDPSVILVDVRTEEEYKKFSLPGSINIPFDSVLNENFSSYVNQDIYKIIFYSNGNTLADKTWLVCRGLDYKNIYVMTGGLNEWVKTILRPVKPSDTESSDAFAMYEFRKGASKYFGGGGSDGASSSVGAPAPSAPKGHKKKKAGGGCE